MDKAKESAVQQRDQSGSEIIQNPERIVCSPEFPDGCIDVETGKSEKWHS